MLDRAKSAYLAAREGIGHLLFERSKSVETAGRVDLGSLGLDTDERISYTPSHWLTLRRALPPRSVDGDDVLLDYGSGKGRVLLQAARYPLKRVIGLELSPQLNEVARANLDNDSSRRRCGDVELVTGDALEYRPPDDVTIVYMYNPFKGSVFLTAVEHLIASVDRSPRRVRIVYMNPVEHDALLATGRVRLVRRIHGLRPTPRWSRSAATYLYEIVPQASR